MGVNTFLLDNRTATLLIGGGRHTVGTLHRFFKLTELDEERVAEHDAANAAARLRPSPAAALIMDITDLPLADEPDKPIATHLVLGWDEGRGSVTDFGWDYLPQLIHPVSSLTGFLGDCWLLRPNESAESHLKPPFGSCGGEAGLL